MSVYPARTPLPLFDRATARPGAAGNGAELPPSLGAELKREGIDRAESHEPSLAERLRGHLRDLARERGSVTIDDARDYAEEHGLVVPHKNFWGALFRPSDWVAVTTLPSRRPAKHAHRNTVWCLRETGARGMR